MCCYTAQPVTPSAPSISQPSSNGLIKMTGVLKNEVEDVSLRALSMNRAIAVALVLLSEIAAFGQQPEGKSTPIDFSLYAGVIATRTMDYISTENVLAGGGRELFLPRFLVTDKPMFAAFSVGSGVGEIYVSRILRKSHPKVARSILIGDIVSAGLIALHNEAIVQRKAK